LPSTVLKKPHCGLMPSDPMAQAGSPRHAASEIVSFFQFSALGCDQPQNQFFVFGQVTYREVSRPWRIEFQK
jgi:hypothetical protein